MQEAIKGELKDKGLENFFSKIDLTKFGDAYDEKIKERVAALILKVADAIRSLNLPQLEIAVWLDGNDVLVGIKHRHDVLLVCERNSDIACVLGSKNGEF